MLRIRPRRLRWLAVSMRGPGDRMNAPGVYSRRFHGRLRAIISAAHDHPETNNEWIHGHYHTVRRPIRPADDDSGRHHAAARPGHRTHGSRRWQWPFAAGTSGDRPRPSGRGTHSRIDARNHRRTGRPGDARSRTRAPARGRRARKAAAEAPKKATRGRRRGAAARGGTGEGRPCLPAHARPGRRRGGVERDPQRHRRSRRTSRFPVTPLPGLAAPAAPDGRHRVIVLTRSGSGGSSRANHRYSCG